MREPDLYIASFHRQNLRYVVHESEARTQLELLAHDSPCGGDGRIPGGERDCGDSLSREDGNAPAPAKSGTMDVRRSAGAGGNDRVRPWHQQTRGARGDSSVAAEVD